MRIALIVPTFPKLSETFIISKVLGLLDRGWDVQIVCTRKDEIELRNFAPLDSRSNILHRVHRSWPTQPRWLAAALLPFVLLRTLVRNHVGVARYLRVGWQQAKLKVLHDLYLDALLVELKPDLVHFEFGALAKDRMHLKARLGVKILVSFRGYDLNYAGLETPGYFDEVWAHSDAVHLLSEDLWKRAKDRGCPESKPHSLIAPAVRVQDFQQTERTHTQHVGTSERPLRIISVGRIEWVKGYEYALQAVRILQDRGICCEYQIIGHGALVECIVLGCQQLGLTSTVTLKGSLPPAQVREQLDWADVMLHAAVSEGFCNAVIEAQAAALPVVCTDAGGLPENVVDGVTGFVVQRRNPRALADRLGLLAHDPALRQSMAQAGHSRVVEQFRIEDQISSFEEVYRQTIND